MKSSFLLLAILASGACSGGDGRPAGTEESRTYDFKDFDSVSAETGIDLTLKQGPFAIEAASQDGDLSRLKIETRGSTLSLSSQSMLTIGRSPTYKVTVTAPDYQTIDASAGVRVNGENLKLNQIRLTASTGVAAKLSGECTAIDASASAGATINTRDLKCASATLDASAGARIEAWASEKAAANASAGAVIDIYGAPPTVEKDADIAGVINVH